MFIILIMIMDSCQTHETVYFKYVQFITSQLCLNKVILKVKANMVGLGGDPLYSLYIFIYIIVWCLSSPLE